MPDWMKYNHVRRSVAATGMVVEARPGRACADCALWRAWTPGDERCGVCVRWGGLTTRDGWAGVCGGFLEITKGTKGVGRCPTPREGARLPPPRGRACGLPLADGTNEGDTQGRGGVRLFDFG